MTGGGTLKDSQILKRTALKTWGGGRRMGKETEWELFRSIYFSNTREKIEGDPRGSNI